MSMYIVITHTIKYSVRAGSNLPAKVPPTHLKCQSHRGPALQGKRSSDAINRPGTCACEDGRVSCDCMCRRKSRALLGWAWPQKLVGVATNLAQGMTQQQHTPNHIPAISLLTHRSTKVLLVDKLHKKILIRHQLIVTTKQYLLLYRLIKHSNGSKYPYMCTHV